MIFTVLGAGGFIGSHLVADLERQGHTVFAPARRDPVPFDRPLGHVIYCIGLTADFRTRPFDTVRAHVTVLADLLEKADFTSLLYLSSTRVYARSPAAREDAPLCADPNDPSDLYNLSKLAGESLCLSCGRREVRVARLSNVVGHDPASENFLSALIRAALGGSVALQSAPESEKDYVLLEDVVGILPRIAAGGRERVYNVAGGRNLRHGDIAARLAEITGCGVAAPPGLPRQGFPQIDIGRLREEFGFAPASVLDSLPGIVAGYRAAMQPPNH